MRDQKDVLFVLFAAILWGTTGTAQTFAPESASPVMIGAVRLAVGGFAMLGFVVIQGKFDLRGWSVVPTLIAALGMALFQPLFFSAVAATGVAIGTVVAIGSAPILAGILEWTVRGVAPERRWWAATIVTITGCFLLFMNGQEMRVTPMGLIMALGAGLSFAVYTLVSKQLLKQHASDLVVAVVFTLSALFLTPVLFMYDVSWVLQFRGFAVAMHVGLLATALAYLCFARGLTGLTAATGVSLSLAEPLTAAMLGVVVVGEVLTPVSWIGVGLMFLGLAFLTTRSRTPPRAVRL